MVVVKHDGSYYNLYVSDVTGVKFSLSLENILSNRTYIWKKKTTLVDIHRVTIEQITIILHAIIYLSPPVFLPGRGLVGFPQKKLKCRIKSEANAPLMVHNLRLIRCYEQNGHTEVSEQFFDW